MHRTSIIKCLSYYTEIIEGAPSPLAYCFRPILALSTAYRLTTKTTIFGVSIYIKKIVMTVSYMHMYNHSFLLVSFPSFRPPKIKFIKAEMTPQQAQAKRAHETFRVI